MSDGLRDVLFQRRKVVLIQLLTLVESPLQSSQVVNFHSWSRQKEIVCMVRCMSKRDSPSRYPYPGLGLAHSTCLDLHLT